MTTKKKLTPSPSAGLPPVPPIGWVVQPELPTPAPVDNPCAFLGPPVPQDMLDPSLLRHLGLTIRFNAEKAARKEREKDCLASAIAALRGNFTGKAKREVKVAGAENARDKLDAKRNEGMP
jgi:hypothetical protein